MTATMHMPLWIGKYRIRDIRVMTTSESTNASDTVNAVKHRKSKRSKIEGSPECHKSKRNHQASNTPPCD